MIALQEQLAAGLAGRYEIDRELGQGGMATVFLARDIRHDRQVALKVLHPDLAAALGAERFLAEIRTTANLQHPHILPLHDSGEANGFLFYVMPFVEGETLRARIERERQLPLDHAIRITTEVLGALDYAHRHGVIHRDVKPENILLHDGSALVADFGIALAVTAAAGSRMTQTGLSLGTPQYMSPEQAMGEKHIDARTDIYAAGVVLYEMLTGEPPFSGTTVQAIVAKVMTERPTPPRTVRDTVPPHVEAATLRALAKLPADRFHSAADFATALHDATAVPVTTGVRVMTPRRRLAAIALPVTAVLLAILAASGWWKATHRAAAAPVRFVLTLEPGEVYADPPGLSLAVSPDGRTVAYLVSSGGLRQLRLRNLGDVHARTVQGGDAASDIRFSPDGQWLAFFVGDEGRYLGNLVKVSVEGGVRTTLARTTGWQGMTWGSSNRIVYSSAGQLWSVGPDGSSPKVIVVPDSAAGQRRPSDPFVLPDGKTVAFRISTRSGERLAIVPLDGGAHTVVDLDMMNVIAYVDGWLVFGRSDGSIAATRFDLKRRRVEGGVVPIMDGLRVKGGGVVAAVSRAGTAAFLHGPIGATLSILDERGTITMTARDLRLYTYPAWSPDGTHIAFTIGSLVTTGVGANDIWVMDVQSQTVSRLTSNGGTRPAWSPDGKRIAFIKESGGDVSPIFSIPADGSGPEELITTGRFREVAYTPDGRHLLTRVDRVVPTQYARGIWIIDLAGDRSPKPVLLDSIMPLAAPMASPDGRWLVYQSEETGRFEIYVRPLSGAGARVQVSVAGGAEPRWTADGRRIVYRASGNYFVAARVSTSARGFAVESRDSLFVDRYRRSATTRPGYDVHPDGRHFVVVGDAADKASLEVVTNWLDELRARLP